MWDPSGPELRMPSCAHTHNPLSTCQKQACILSWLPARHAAAAAQVPEEAARPCGIPAGQSSASPPARTHRSPSEHFVVLLDLTNAISAVAKIGAG